jgi:hypothetical protein
VLGRLAEVAEELGATYVDVERVTATRDGILVTLRVRTAAGEPPARFDAVVGLANECTSSVRVIVPLVVIEGAGVPARAGNDPTPTSNLRNRRSRVRILSGALLGSVTNRMEVRDRARPLETAELAPNARTASTLGRGPSRNHRAEMA